MNSSILILSVASTLLSAPVTPAGFDASTGKLSLSAAAIGASLDALSGELGEQYIVEDSESYLSSAQAAEQFQTAPAEAIEGQGYLRLGPSQRLRVRLDSAQLGRLADRRVEIKFWKRARGSDVLGVLWWYTLEGVGEQEGLSAIFFQPTGAATDDGWVELSSGPIDVSTAGLMPTLVDIRASSPSGTAWVDGLGIWDVGEKQVPEARCSLPTEASACGAEGACLYGRCVNASMVVGPAIYNPELRQQYIQRLLFEAENFEGGRTPLSLTNSQLRPKLEAVIPSSVGTRAFREAILTGFHELEDGHASPPTAAYIETHNGGLCMYKGSADLLPAGGNAPLVYSAGAFSELQTGDALVSVDGLSPAAWMALAHRYSYFAGDAEAREVVDTPLLIQAAIQTGATLSFRRCSNSSGCSEGQLQTIVVDLAAQLEPFWKRSATHPFASSDVCDFRFISAAPSSGDNAYAYAGYQVVGGTTQIQINGVPGSVMEGGSAWASTIDAALNLNPQQVIIDQRRGMGGMIDAVNRIAGHLMPASTINMMEVYPQLDVRLSDTLRNRLMSCAGGDYACAEAISWPLAAGDAGSAGARTALLSGSDVSGNDYLAMLLKLRRSGPTRLFGAAPTWGAFGPIWTRAGHLTDIDGGSFQVSDTSFSVQALDAIQFTTGAGVEQDEIVLQKQSDLLNGVDTQLQAAQAWVRGN